MNEIIASRELEIRQAGVVTGKVLVQIEKPRQTSGGEFHCAFTIQGLDIKHPPYAVGEDSMQALVLALSMIQSTLQESELGRRGELSWLCSQDLGFAVQ